MKKPRERLNRIIEGLDTGEFELVGFEARTLGMSFARVTIELRRTPKRQEPGSGKPRPKRPRDFAKQTRELIFDDEEEFV